MKIHLPFSLAPFQKDWMALFSDVSKRAVAVLAARGAGKSWTVALWCVRQMFTFPGTQISIVPGGSEEQGSQIIEYMKDIIYSNSKLRSSLVSNAVTSLRLANSSRLKVYAPTVRKVQGPRGHIIIEEAQLIPEAIAIKLKAVASKKGNRTIMIGTPETPSWFQKTFEALPEDAKRILTWKEAVAAGTIDQEVIDEARGLIPGIRLTSRQFDEMYECKWVPKAGAMWKVGLPSKPVLAQYTIVGWDFNKRPGFTWVAGHYHAIENRIDLFKHGVIERVGDEDSIANVYKVDSVLAENGLHPNLMVAESNGWNSGFSQLLADVSKYPVFLNDWGGKNKGRDVADFTVGVESGLITSSDPEVRAALNGCVADISGRMIKDEINGHLADAAIHCGMGIGHV